MKNHIKEFWVDPSSGQYSASRLCLMAIVLLFFPALIALDALGIKVQAWPHLAVVVGSVAGVYGINSAGRVWRGRND